MGNKGAFITLEGSNMKPKYTQFESVPHPTSRPMQYAGFGGMNFLNFMS
jgi:serine/threonine-protein phosphatase 5